MKLKYPPYSKPLVTSLENQTPPDNDVYLFIGKKAWEKAKNSSIMRPSRTLCLPPNDSPFTYQWPVALCDILVIDTSPTNEELIKDLVAALFEYGAVIVRYVSNQNKLTVFKRI